MFKAYGIGHESYLSSAYSFNKPDSIWFVPRKNSDKIKDI